MSIEKMVPTRKNIYVPGKIINTDREQTVCNQKTGSTFYLAILQGYYRGYDKNLEEGERKRER